MSLKEFREILKGGGARPNQFRVNLSFPAIVAGATEAARKGQFLCTGTTLPGSAVTEVDVFYRGRRVPLAGERQFANWDVTILNDTDFEIRSALERWSNALNNYSDNTGVTAHTLYTAQLEVTQLGRNGEALKKYVFENAWPSQISPIQLDFSSNNQIENFSVSFAYTSFKPA